MSSIEYEGSYTPKNSRRHRERDLNCNSIGTSLHDTQYRTASPITTLGKCSINRGILCALFNGNLASVHSDPVYCAGNAGGHDPQLCPSRNLGPNSSNAAQSGLD